MWNGLLSGCEPLVYRFLDRKRDLFRPVGSGRRPDAGALFVVRVDDVDQVKALGVLIFL